MKKKIEFLNLGLQPLANRFLTKNQLNFPEKKYFLKICFDKENFLVSIKNTFSSKKMFNNKYPYRTSMSKTIMNSLENLSKKIKKDYSPKNILEIGSNDGSFLKYFIKYNAVGIEPCENIALISKKNGVNVFSRYWNKNTKDYLQKKFGKFDLIYSANTISHIQNLDQVFRNIEKSLTNNGVLIIEDPSLLECIKKNTYDQFYNEHIYVFSAISLNKILKKNKLVIFKIEKLDIHGGSNRYYVKKRSNKRQILKSFYRAINEELKFKLNKLHTFKKFSKKVIKSKFKLIQIFKKIKSSNNKIIGYGATAKSATILNYCNLDNSYIDFFLDTTPEKINKFTPGTRIMVKKYKNGIPKNIKYVFLGAWNFKKEIFLKEKQYIKNGGKFITHTPTPKIL